MCNCGSSLPVPPVTHYYNLDPCKQSGNCDDPCEDCMNDGCKQQIDPECIIFGLNGPTEDLSAIPAERGDSLVTILKNINDKLASNNPLDMSGIAMGYLSTKYTINTFKDLIEAIVDELEHLKSPTPVSTTFSPCFTFVIRNEGTSIASYNMRDCSGAKQNNISIAAGGVREVTARGVSSSYPAVRITNNGVL